MLWKMPLYTTHFKVSQIKLKIMCQYAHMWAVDHPSISHELTEEVSGAVFSLPVSLTNRCKPFASAQSVLGYCWTSCITKLAVGTKAVFGCENVCFYCELDIWVWAVGLHCFWKTINCDCLDWDCNCNIICYIRVNKHYSYFHKKHMKMIKV